MGDNESTRAASQIFQSQRSSQHRHTVGAPGHGQHDMRVSPRLHRPGSVELRLKRKSLRQGHRGWLIRSVGRFGGKMAVFGQGRFQ
jgi:hypothetical protein